MTKYCVETQILQYCVLKKRPKKKVLSLGFFDSVHIGHREIIAVSARMAREFGMVPAIYTFDNDFFKALGSDEKLIYTLSERMTVFSEAGIAPENVIVGSPSETVIKMSGEEFLDKMSLFNVGAVVCGADFRFGSGAACGTDDLKAWGAAHGIPVVVVPLKTEWQRKISSRDIREYIGIGEVKLAEHFLARPFFVRGTVEHDRGAGRKNGLPTVNLSVDPRKLLPADGVYYTRVILKDGSAFKGVTNIGSRPTYGVRERALETHIIDFKGDLYGKTLTIEFKDRLRGIFKFDSKEALRAQILEDIEKVRGTIDD